MTNCNSVSTSWQALYRALLRSSSASVRFARPAARNTRRYLRDEFAAALASTAPVSPSKSKAGSKTGARAKSARNNDSAKLTGALRHHDIRQLTSNTLAFHLSASLHQNLDSTASDPASGESGVSSPSSHPSCVGVAAARTSGTTSHASPKIPVGKGGRLAHRIISNLSTLTYHHLSPHTQMQSPRSAHLRESRAALRKPKRLSSLARVLGKLDSSTSLPGEEADDLELQEGKGEEGTMLNLAHMKLSFLTPSPKPIRGPKEAKLKNWDGQDPDKIGSEGALRQMQEDLTTIERLLDEHDRRGNKGAGKQAQQLRGEAEGLRKKVKAAAKGLAQAEEKSEVEKVGIEHLAELVAAAQEREGLMLGKERWVKRARGDFLPP